MTVTGTLHPPGAQDALLYGDAPELHGTGDAQIYGDAPEPPGTGTAATSADGMWIGRVTTVSQSHIGVCVDAGARQNSQSRKQKRLRRTLTHGSAQTWTSSTIVRHSPLSITWTLWAMAPFGCGKLSRIRHR
jgi:hypothetical protein